MLSSVIMPINESLNMPALFIRISMFLTSLNIKNGSNVNIFGFDATNNPSLTCIEVDDAVSAISGSGNYSSWSKDTTANYAENCNSLSEPGNTFSNQITIYPNPAQNQITVESYNLNSEEITIELVDMTGRVVLNVFNGFVMEGEFTQVTADISNLPTGMYFMRYSSQSDLRVDKVQVVR